MEAEILKSSALIWDIVQSFVRDVIKFSAPNSVIAADITIAAFVFCVLGYIVTAAGCLIRKQCNQGTRNDFPMNCLLFLKFAGGILYMIGDNISRIPRDYPDELNCNTTCIEMTVSAGEGLLALVVPLYFFSLIVKWFDAFKLQRRKQTTAPIPPLDALRLVILAHEFDVVFTAIERQVPEACSIPYHIVAWIIWVVYITVLAVATFLTLNYYVRKNRVKLNCKVSNIYLGMVVLFTALYLLVDNNVPLNCSEHVVSARFALWIP